MVNESESASGVTKVTIFGQELALHSSESPDYTREVARLVNAKMAKIASQQNLADPTKIAIMTALEIADDLIRKRESRESSSERVQEATQRLSRTLDRTGSDG